MMVEAWCYQNMDYRKSLHIFDNDAEGERGKGEIRLDPQLQKTICYKNFLMQAHTRKEQKKLFPNTDQALIHSYKE